MNNQKIIKNIYQELASQVDKEYYKISKAFFKEKIDILGVRTPIVRKISSKYYPEIKNLEKKEVWNICEKLLVLEDEFKMIAFDWAFRQKKFLTEKDFPVLEKWCKKHVSNWSTCDDFCTHALGFLIFKFEKLAAQTGEWAYSKNRWLRRASAVVLIYSLRRDKYLNKAFQIADILLEDPDDLVQKGYGWMLKEAAKTQEKKIFEYVIKNKHKMQRTALRYAIEKMPIKFKKEAMQK